MNIITKSNAQIFLIINAILWGSSYIWSKMLLGFLPQFSILLICAVLGLCSTIILFRKKLQGFNKKIVVTCVLISLISVVSNTFCMLALKKTSGSNTAFIVQLSIVITPIIMAVLERKVPSRKTILPAMAAMVGIYLITFAGKGMSVNPGDIFALCNAIFFSLFIALQNKFSNVFTAVQFTFVQHSTNIVCFLALALIFETGKIVFSNAVNPLFILLICLNATVTIFTSLFQSSAIKFVRPENAAIMYALEPVVTTVLGILLLGESFSGILTVLGCVIILFTIIISACKKGRFYSRESLKLRITTKA
ncbi:DMT family transporter [Ruminiclostridium cellulolyticum]|uniref:EamA domain-containing protein n=1 Tax=Ruminiclostridium cellulolyticum (strain ATCC 35319 / DSM 5812 / JCM 6584 / H10) TaxID=394503 RepID=B8I028_RUMCH|nr:DMT family transporter [Ruminiclostridium cellulolyticum]ACL75528.1 protein of unknown function DUF6 transmembrane [Ruminiclostridium cellulolyticum H10]